MTDAPGWKLEIVANEATMSRRAADLVSATVMRLPAATIAVPTGSTPLGMFADLTGRVERGALDLSLMHLFCLDEYVGVTADDPNSLTGWLERAFIAPAQLDRANVHTLPTDADNLAEAAAHYEAELADRGGLNLAVLGLGPNGHVAYNEPGAAAHSRTRIVDLTPESIAQASEYWQGTVPIPNRALTIGIGTLLDANQILLIVAGAAKATMLRRALQEEMTADVPASWLRLAGSRLVVLADEAAASELHEKLQGR